MKKPEHDDALSQGPDREHSERSESLAESSRREIARQIALEALRADRHVLEASAATAFRDFGSVKPA